MPLNGIARRVLIQGPSALRAPTLRVGDFFTADRSEIEAVRSLRQLVHRYIDDRKSDKPLSIGVFGPPGAGKSFAVKELAKDLLRDRPGHGLAGIARVPAWLPLSLTKLVEPFRLLRRAQPDAPLSLSSLLPRDQLALHVDLQKFDDLIRRDEETANRLGVDQLAGAVHAYYREKGKASGWIKLHHDRDFAKLSPFDQASNRAAARRIPAILALVGLKLVAGTATEKERSEAESVLTFHADLLAEAEHDGWMDWHFDNGWSQSDTRDDARQLLKLLIPYADLPESEKEKDQDSINHYPDIAELAGLKIVAV